jgi:hypothetical protein
MFLPRRTKSRILWLAAALLWLGLLGVLWGYNQSEIGLVNRLYKDQVPSQSDPAIAVENRRFGLLNYVTLEFTDYASWAVRQDPTFDDNFIVDASGYEYVWHGPALGITILASIIAVPLLLGARRGVLMLWVPRGFCEYCGYNLRGITSDRCPECGAAIHRTPPAEASRRVSTAD